MQEALGSKPSISIFFLFSSLLRCQERTAKKGCRLVDRISSLLPLRIFILFSFTPVICFILVTDSVPAAVGISQTQCAVFMVRALMHHKKECTRPVGSKPMSLT